MFIPDARQCQLIQKGSREVKVAQCLVCVVTVIPKRGERKSVDSCLIRVHLPWPAATQCKLRRLQYWPYPIAHVHCARERHAIGVGCEVLVERVRDGIGKQLDGCSRRLPLLLPRTPQTFAHPLILQLLSAKRSQERRNLLRSGLRSQPQ
jgi:hypothetical protein